MRTPAQMPHWKPSQLAPRVRDSAAAVRRALRELVALGIACEVGEAFSRARQLRCPVPVRGPFSKRGYRHANDPGCWYRHKPKFLEERRG